MFQFYYDSRSSGYGMGDAVEIKGAKVVNVWEKNKPSFNCQYELRDNFLEDFDGVLGPSGKGRGSSEEQFTPLSMFLTRVLSSVFYLS